MRNYLLAAVAAAALTSPAVARDKSTYVGISGGVLLVEDTNLDYADGFVPEVRDAITIDHKYGFDVDLYAGYDFGLVRAEAEISYKRASLDEVQLDTDFVPSPNPTEPYDASGKVSVGSAMVNVLFDFGDEDSWSGFLGAGVGYAQVSGQGRVGPPTRRGQLRGRPAYPGDDQGQCDVPVPPCRAQQPWQAECFGLGVDRCDVPMGS